MNILLLGSGGREHALAWKLASSTLTDRLFCAPGNAGIAQEAECVALDITDHAAVIAFCKANTIDFVVVGPEGPLVAGVVDDLEAAGLKTFGPTKSAARLEGSAPETTTTIVLADELTIDPRLVVEALHGRGHRRILSEAGPHTFGVLLEAGLVDELFLTSSPLLVGDGGPGSRLALVEGADLTPHGTNARLLSVRRHGSHLFTRFALAD